VTEEREKQEWLSITIMDSIGYKHTIDIIELANCPIVDDDRIDVLLREMTQRGIADRGKIGRPGYRNNPAVWWSCYLRALGVQDQIGMLNQIDQDCDYHWVYPTGEVEEIWRKNPYLQEALDRVDEWLDEEINYYDETNGDIIDMAQGY